MKSIILFSLLSLFLFDNNKVAGDQVPPPECQGAVDVRNACLDNNPGLFTNCIDCFREQGSNITGTDCTSRITSLCARLSICKVDCHPCNEAVSAAELCIENTDSNLGLEGCGPITCENTTEPPTTEPPTATSSVTRGFGEITTAAMMLVALVNACLSLS